jgi:uncharacterized protein involved in outer membrane biogenesis
MSSTTLDRYLHQHPGLANAYAWIKAHRPGKRAAKWAAYIIGFLLVLIVVAGLYLATHWRELLQGKASPALGREFAVEGPLSVDWNWRAPRFRAEQVRLANTENAADPYMVDIGRLEVQIEIWKLLVGKISIPDLVLDRPKIILEKDAEGKGNWELPIMSSGNTATEAALPDDRSEVPVIGAFAVTNGTLVYRDAVKKLDLELQLDTASAKANEESFLRASGKGTLQDNAFNLALTGGSVDMLRDSSKPYPLDLKLDMGATHVGVQGTFTDPVKMQGMDALLDLKGDNLADIFYLTGIPLPPTPPYTLNGRLIKKDDIWSFQKFAGTVGDSDLSGDLKYDTCGDRGAVTANLVSQRLDMDDLGGFVGLQPGTGKGETASKEQTKEANADKRDDRVLPDVPIALDRLRSADMDVTLKAASLNAPGWPLNDMLVRFDLKDGMLRLDPLQFGVADGKLDGTMAFDGTKDVPHVDMNIDLNQLRLKRFFDGTRFESLSAGRFGGNIELSGDGKSLAEVLGTSDGRVVMSMSGGRVSLMIIEGTNLDIAELTPLLLGEDRSTAVRCAVTDFTVKNGLLRSQLFVIDTEDTNITGGANINLKNEAIDAKIDAHPKDPSLLAAKGPIIVTGTMADPSIGLSTMGMGARTGAAAILGTVLTPIGAIIPFIELGTGKDSDCRDLIAHARAAGAPK